MKINFYKLHTKLVPMDIAASPTLFPNLINVFPQTLTVLVTYQCTAACPQCCFECTPHLKGRISTSKILEYIDNAHESFPNLQLIVFSGGECFLLGDDLITVVSHAHEKGLSVRCVTNGYWGKTLLSADRWMVRLKEAGLTELNLSTGDEHQQYVPFSSVANAASSAVDHGIRTLMVVETDTVSEFNVKEAMKFEQIKALQEMHPNRHLFHLMGNIWFPFQKDKCEPSVNGNPIQRVGVSSKGCEHVFHTLTITPHECLATCCGLTMEHIPELKIGDLAHDEKRTMRDMFIDQSEDFLKIWLNVDGPEEILRVVAEEIGMALPEDVRHPCQACAILHKHPQIRDYLSEHYTKWVRDVFLRFSSNLGIQGHLLVK